MASLLRRPGNVARYSRRASELLAISPSRALHPSSSLYGHRSRLLRLSYNDQQRSCVRSYATSGSSDPKPPRNNGSKKKGESGSKKTESGKGNDPIESKLTAEEEKLLDDFKPFYEQLTTGPFGVTGPSFAEFQTIVRRQGMPPEVKSFIESLEGNSRGFLSLADFKNAAVFSKYMAAIRTNQKPETMFTDGAPKLNMRNNQDPKSDKEKSKKEGEQKTEDQKQQQQHQKQQQQKKDPGQKPKGFELKLDAGNILVTTILAYYIYHSIFPGESTREITWQEFRNNFFDKGLVEKLTVINRNRVRVELNRDAVGSVYPDSPAVQPNFHYIFTIGSVDAFERKLEEAHKELDIPPSQWIPVAYVDEVSWLHTLASLGPTVILLGSFLWLSRRAAGGGAGQSGIFGIGKSRAKRFNHETDIKIRFADVAGMDEAKLEIMEFVSFLKEPEKFSKLGAKIPRGAILSGPPGTGKTLLAKATAGESGVPFFSVSGSEFVEMFVGVGPSRVRDLFANARKNTPCIIFIDEIDAIGKSRAKQSFGGGNDERESTLNQILTEMDGFNTSEQVVVLAGTNRPDVLDKALMRPGRFDRHIAIDRPTMDGRKQIFRVHLKKIVTKEDFDYLCGRLAALTPGFSGADIANCVNEAALVAAREHADFVVMKHFEQAIERVVGGLEKKSLVLSPEEKRTVAYHEAGHAICGWYFKWADPLLKVSIIPRGQGALGYAQYLPAGGDTYLMNVNQLMDRMAMTLGGRVSEELHFDTVTSGASDDFNKVTRMASAMVTKFGMSPKIGYIYFEEDQQQLHKPFSEETARNIDLEVKRIVDDAYTKCRDLLTEKKKEVGLVAEELLSKEVLSRDDLVRILGPRPFPDPGEFTKYFGAGASQPGQTIAPPEPPSVNEGTDGKDGRDQTPLPT